MYKKSLLIPLIARGKKLLGHKVITNYSYSSFKRLHFMWQEKFPYSVKKMLLKTCKSMYNLNLMWNKMLFVAEVIVNFIGYKTKFNSKNSF